MVATSDKDQITELQRFSAAQARIELDQKNISSEELVKACLDRIELREKDLNAWTFIDPDLAISQARKLDNELKRSEIHGIPIGIKDIYDTCDMPTAYGTSFMKNHKPSRDSNWVSILRSAGAVLIGKTKTTEFANAFPTTTRNPHNLSRSPGASSSGSAAAVADFMVPLAIGSQTGGSIIRPAAYCGVHGYKPSIEGLPKGNVRHAKPSIDTPGIFSRSIKDISVLRSVSMNDSSRVSTISKINSLRIGLCRTEHWDHAMPETKEIIKETTEIVSKHGISLQNIQLPDELSEAMEEFSVIVTLEDARAISKDCAEQFERLNPWSQRVLKEANEFSSNRYQNAKKLAERARDKINHIFENIDFIITPATRGEAPLDIESVEPSYFNSVWTLMHLPCISLPAFTGPNGMPLGLQIVGPVNDDSRLLTAAKAIENVINNHNYPT